MSNKHDTVDLNSTMQRLNDRTGAVVMNGTYPTDIEDLWNAVTQPERLSRWLGQVEGDLRVGGQFTARFTSSWEGPGRVDVCEPPHRLVCAMGGEAEASTVIEANLSVEGPELTRLVIEERGLPLPQLFAHGAGWQAHVEDLAAHLEGRPAGDWHQRWTALSPEYRRRAESL